MRILLISYYFPPYNTVGAVRPGKFAKYLIQNGHEVEVVCAFEPPYSKGLSLEIPQEFVHPVRGWSVNSLVRFLLQGRTNIPQGGIQSLGVRRSFLRAFSRFYKQLFYWPDAEIGWAKVAFNISMKLIRQRRFDVIYVSAPPFSALRTGAMLAEYTGIPWVAEFRDLWTSNHAYDQPLLKLKLERLWENKLLKNASALITVSLPLSEKLSRHGLPVWVVRNGYDPDDFLNIEHINIKTDEDSLLIIYTGSIYPDNYDLDLFCEGLALFKSNGYRAEIRIVGRNVQSILEVAERHGVDSLFVVSNAIPRLEALAMQRCADVLLMFLWEGGEEGIFTTKLFEYFGAARPILAIGSRQSDVGTWINSEKIGKFVHTPHEVADQLICWINQKRAGNLNVDDSIPRHNFTRSQQYASLIEKLKTLNITSK